MGFRKRDEVWLGIEPVELHLVHCWPVLEGVSSEVLEAADVEA